MFPNRQIPQPAWLVSLLFATLQCALTLDVVEATEVNGGFSERLLYALLTVVVGYVAGTCFLIYALGSTRILLIMSVIIPILILDFLDLLERLSTNNDFANAHLALFTFSWQLMPVIIYLVRKRTRHLDPQPASQKL